MLRVERWKLLTTISAVVVTIVAALGLAAVILRTGEEPGDKAARARIIEMVDNLMRQSTVHYSKEQYGGKPGVFRAPVDSGTFRYAVDLRDWSYLLERELSHLDVYPDKELSVGSRKYMQSSNAPGQWIPSGPGADREEIEFQALSLIVALRELEHNVRSLDDTDLDGVPVERYLALGELWSPLGGIFSSYEIWIDASTDLPVKMDIVMQEVATPPHTIEGFQRLFCNGHGRRLRVASEAPLDTDPLLVPIPLSQPYEAECIDAETGERLAHWRFITEWDSASRQVLTFTAFNEPVPIPDSLPRP